MPSLSDAGKVQIALRSAQARRQPEMDEIHRRLIRLEILEATSNEVLRDGTVTLTDDWDIGDGHRILADGIRARDGAGLRLEDDAGGLGLFVKDGGNVSVGTDDADERLHVEGVRPVLKLKDNSGSGNSAAGWLAFYDSGDTRQMFLGAASVSNSDIYVRAEAGGLRLGDSTGDVLLLSGGNLGTPNNAALGESWNAVSFNTGWQNAAGGYDVGYRKFGDMVMLRGRMERTSGTETTAFTLPAGYRPSDNVVFNGIFDSGGGFIDILIGSSGDVQMSGVDNGDWIPLDGLAFSL